MQPPTDPNPKSSRRTLRGRHGDEAELYERHHRHLLRAVARTVNAPPELIEDACQTAWTALLRCRVERATVFGWLCAAAIHEAWRQWAQTRTELPAGTFRTPHPCELPPGEDPEPAADTPAIPDQVAARMQHAQRLADLATLKPNDRRALYLKALGYRYREIIQITGASYTAVNRRLTEGRRQLHKLEHERENACHAERAEPEPDLAPRA
jgi:DNA-directed RNA polymerase specialized sigma24 family protein